MNTKKYVNTTLELIKLLASYMVVFIHVRFDGDAGIVMETLARFAVPLFFLISGFYSYQITPEKILKRIKNVSFLLVFGVVGYTLYNIFLVMIWESPKDILLYFVKYCDIGVWFQLIFMNVPVSSDHLWYLFAILYVYIIFYFVTKHCVREKLVYILAFVLLFINILLSEGLSAFGIVFDPRNVRNFALMGIPFFTMGLLVRKHENKVKNIPGCVSVFAAVIGIFGSIVSRYIWGRNELYLGSVFILFALIMVFVKYPNIQYPHFLYQLTGCSTYIYIFHLMVSTAFMICYSQLNIDMEHSAILRNLHPLIVCAASTVASYCMVRILKVVPVKKAER